MKVEITTIYLNSSRWNNNPDLLTIYHFTYRIEQKHNTLTLGHNGCISDRIFVVTKTVQITWKYQISHHHMQPLHTGAKIWKYIQWNSYNVCYPNHWEFTENIQNVQPFQFVCSVRLYNWIAFNLMSYILCIICHLNLHVLPVILSLLIEEHVNNRTSASLPYILH